jgi:hypothetical protein
LMSLVLGVIADIVNPNPVKQLPSAILHPWLHCLPRTAKVHAELAPAALSTACAARSGNQVPQLPSSHNPRRGATRRIGLIFTIPRSIDYACALTRSSRHATQEERRAGGHPGCRDAFVGGDSPGRRCHGRRHASPNTNRANSRSCSRAGAPTAAETTDRPLDGRSNSVPVQGRHQVEAGR